MQKGEIRQNKATRQWVIFAPSRGKRPNDFKRTDRPREDLPIRDETCPFCPGNERMLTEIILEMKKEGENRLVDARSLQQIPGASAQWRCDP